MTDTSGRPETNRLTLGALMKKIVILALAGFAVLSAAACTTVGKGKAPAPAPSPVVSRAG
jgi:hypothetical protein